MTQDPRPIRILHVLYRMNRGGVETWLMRVLRQLDRQQIHMDFLVQTEEPGAYDDEIRQLGSRVIACPLDRWRPWEFARNFQRILAEQGPFDVVHSHIYLFSGYLLWLAGRARPRPYRISNIYPPWDHKKNNLARKLYRRGSAFLIGRHADELLFCSQHSLESFLGEFPFLRQPRSVHYPGIDLSPFRQSVSRQEIREQLGLPVDKPLVTYVARFSPHKNQAQMVRVADQLNRDGYRFHFAMAGSHGTEMPAMQQAATQRPYVSVLTGLPDISPLMLASDVFFFPSLHEGFGMVAAEAAAAGLPVVATRLATIMEACPSGCHELMFPADDDQAAGANLLRVLEDESLRERLSVDARAWSRRMSTEASAEALVQTYRSGLSR
jgi:glycosyltransferase involved in cell wall biosynthesis